MIFLAEFFEKKKDFEIKSADDKQVCKLLSRQRTKLEKFTYFYDVIYISVFQRIARNKNDPSHWFDYGTFCLYINDITKVGHRSR